MSVPAGAKRTSSGSDHAGCVAGAVERAHGVGVPAGAREILIREARSRGRADRPAVAADLVQLDARLVVDDGVPGDRRRAVGRGLCGGGRGGRGDRVAPGHLRGRLAGDVAGTVVGGDRVHVHPRLGGVVDEAGAAGAGDAPAVPRDPVPGDAGAAGVADGAPGQLRRPRAGRGLHHPQPGDCGRRRVMRHGRHQDPHDAPEPRKDAAAGDRADGVDVQPLAVQRRRGEPGPAHLADEAAGVEDVIAGRMLDLGPGQAESRLPQRQYLDRLGRRRSVMGLRRSGARRQGAQDGDDHDRQTRESPAVRPPRTRGCRRAAHPDLPPDPMTGHGHARRARQRAAGKALVGDQPRRAPHPAPSGLRVKVGTVLGSFST